MLNILLLSVVAYLGFGLIFAVAFALRGAAAIDSSAATSTWGFRVLIIPGAAALWPLLGLRWRRSKDSP